MGQKVVIKLEVNGKRPASIAKKMVVGMLKAMMPCECMWDEYEHTPPKNKRKAMKIAVGFTGVKSTALEGEAKDELVVKGEGFDPVKLVSKLRDKVGGASIKSVGPEEEKEKEKPQEGTKQPEDSSGSANVHPFPPPLVICELPDHNPRCFFF